MPGHIVRIGALIILIIACLFLPFLPGRYDGLAVPLSTMAQIFGVVGLLLVPIGVLWFVFDRSNKARGYYFAIAALVGLSIVASAVDLCAAVSLGVSAGIVAAAASLYGLSRMAMSMKRRKNENDAKFIPATLYLMVVPVVVAIVQFFASPSRHRVEQGARHQKQHATDK